MAAIAELVPHAGATRYDMDRPVSARFTGAGWLVSAQDARGDAIFEAEIPDVEAVIAALIDGGFVVSRWHAHCKIRAWRGDSLPITRIDFRRESSGRWRIRKFKAGWTATTEPAQDYLAPAGWDIDEALAWFAASPPEDHGDPDGWIVNRVGSRFARAWLGPRKPAHRDGVVIRRRRQVEAWGEHLHRLESGDPSAQVGGDRRPDWVPEDVTYEDLAKPIFGQAGAVDLAFHL